MQKLKQYACFLAGGDRGSALITSVVFALLLAVAGIGFLIVTTSSINNDSDAYTSDRAFYAAESGALIAAKYLMSRSFNSWPANPHTFYQDKRINGLYVTVTFITSTAHTAETFRKRVTIVIQNNGP
jgi:Tfp pilus assembly protein PilX